MTGVCSLCGDSAHAGEVTTCPRTGLLASSSGPCGTQIDRYRVDRWIGTGGMGSVYEARHLHLGQPVAMKILQSHLATNATVVERFVREAQAAAAIGNRHIVRIFDFGVAPSGQPFFVMELLEGADLEALIEAGAPFPIAWSLDIALQILNGLGAAHGAGIVHRDLKPANVFLTGVPGTVSGSGDFVKILDFGISKVLHDERSSITGPGMVLGTPAYMAPEQARGARDLDHRVDLYATCAILYELLSGRLPHEGATLEELLVRLCTEPPRPLREVAPSLGADILAVVDRGLSRDPDARFGSARDLSEALLAVKVPEGDPSSIISAPGLTGSMRSYRSFPSGGSSPGYSHHPVVPAGSSADALSRSAYVPLAAHSSSSSGEGNARGGLVETRDASNGSIPSDPSKSAAAFAPTLSASLPGTGPISAITGAMAETSRESPSTSSTSSRPAASKSGREPAPVHPAPSHRSGGGGVWIALVSVSLVALAALSALAAIGLSQIQGTSRAEAPSTPSLEPSAAPVATTQTPMIQIPVTPPSGGSPGSATVPANPGALIPPNGVAALLPLLGIDPDDVASIPGPIQSAPPPTDGVGIGIPFSNSGVDPLSVSNALERSRPQLLACRQPARSITVRVAVIVSNGSVENVTPAWDNTGDLGTVNCVAAAFRAAAREPPLRGSGIVSFEIALGPA